MSAVRLRWFLTMTTILAAAALTVLISNGLDRGSSSEDQVVATPGTSSSTTSSTPTTVTGVSSAAATRVSGTVTAMRLEGAVLEPRQVATPLTVSTDVVPPSVPPPGFEPMANVIVVGALVTTFPKASCSATWTAGAIA